jgi:hypothetical protein
MARTKVSKEKGNDAEEPKVEILGRTIGEKGSWRERRDERHYWHRYYYHRGGGIIWGLLFLLGGLILLGNNTGLIPWTFWQYVQGFWPVLVILIGLRIIVGHGYLARLIMFVVTLFLFGFIIIYALDMVGSPLLRYISPGLLQSVRSVMGRSI